MTKKSDMAADIIGAVKAGTKKWTRTVKAEERNPVSRSYRHARMTQERGVSFKDAAEQIMEEAYNKASGNSAYPANARQIMYAARKFIQDKTGKPLGARILRRSCCRTISKNMDVTTGARLTMREATSLSRMAARGLVSAPSKFAII